MTAISFAEHYSGAYGRFVRERRLTGSIPLSMFEALQPAGDFSDPPVSDLVLIELKSSIRGRWDLGAGHSKSAEAGLIYVVPPNHATDIVIDHPHLFRAFSLPEAQSRIRIEECSDGSLPDFTKLQAAGTRDPFLVSLLTRLWASGSEEGQLGRIFADSAILALLAELVREAGRPSEVAKGGVSPWQLRRVHDLVEASIEQDIGLADLATAADLSPFHFSRAFKCTTGMSPFQFVTKRRLARAQLLLQATDMALVDIALACGFANQSSFTNAFSRETGISPARWRRASR